MADWLDSVVDTLADVIIGEQDKKGDRQTSKGLLGDLLNTGATAGLGALQARGAQEGAKELAGIESQNSLTLQRERDAATLERLKEELAAKLQQQQISSSATLGAAGMNAKAKALDALLSALIQGGALESQGFGAMAQLGQNAALPRR